MAALADARASGAVDFTQVCGQCFRDVCHSPLLDVANVMTHPAAWRRGDSVSSFFKFFGRTLKLADYLTTRPLGEPDIL
jgi:hypothetical protein